MNMERSNFLQDDTRKSRAGCDSRLRVIRAERELLEHRHPVPSYETKDKILQLRLDEARLEQNIQELTGRCRPSHDLHTAGSLDITSQSDHMSAWKFPTHEPTQGFSQWNVAADGTSGDVGFDCGNIAELHEETAFNDLTFWKERQSADDPYNVLINPNVLDIPTLRYVPSQSTPLLPGGLELTTSAGCNGIGHAIDPIQCPATMPGTTYQSLSEDRSSHTATFQEGLGSSGYIDISTSVCGDAPTANAPAFEPGFVYGELESNQYDSEASTAWIDALMEADQTTIVNGTDGIAYNGGILPRGFGEPVHSSHPLDKYAAPAEQVNGPVIAATLQYDTALAMRPASKSDLVPITTKPRRRNEIPGTQTLALGPKTKRPRAPARKEKRDQMRRVRDVGACFRCSVMQIKCSSGDPCQSCILYITSSRYRSASLKLPLCVRRIGSIDSFTFLRSREVERRIASVIEISWPPGAMCEAWFLTRWDSLDSLEAEGKWLDMFREIFGGIELWLRLQHLQSRRVAKFTSNKELDTILLRLVQASYTFETAVENNEEDFMVMQPQSLVECMPMMEALLHHFKEWLSWHCAVENHLDQRIVRHLYTWQRRQIRLQSLLYSRLLQQFACQQAETQKLQVEVQRLEMENQCLKSELENQRLRLAFQRSDPRVQELLLADQRLIGPDLQEQQMAAQCAELETRELQSDSPRAKP